MSPARPGCWSTSGRIGQAKGDVEFAGHEGNVAFCPVGPTFASGSDDGTIRLSGLEQAVQSLGPALFGHTGAASSLGFSPNGAKLASGSADHTIIPWDIEDAGSQSNGAVTHQTLDPCFVSPPPGAVLRVAYSPDGTRLATASADGTTRVWDAAAGQELLTLSGHTDAVVGATWSPDGRRIATASSDGALNVFPAWQSTDIFSIMPRSAASSAS